MVSEKTLVIGKAVEISTVVNTNLEERVEYHVFDVGLKIEFFFQKMVIAWNSEFSTTPVLFPVLIMDRNRTVICQYCVF